MAESDVRRPRQRWRQGARSSSCARNSWLSRIFSGCTTARPASSAASLNGRSGELAISTHGPVGLCDHERNLMFRRAQRFQRLYCKARSPAETASSLYHCLHAASCESCAVQVALRALMRKMNNIRPRGRFSCWKQRESTSTPSHLEPLALLILGADAHLGAWRGHCLANSGKLRQPSSS